MAELSEQILMKRDGGVGRGMGSNGRKGSRKEAAPRRPGPQPRTAPPKKKYKNESMEKARQRKERDKKDKLIAGLQQTVVNSRGRSRGFHENCAYLTLCCSLYEKAAAEIDSKYEPLRLPPSHPCCSPVWCAGCS